MTLLYGARLVTPRGIADPGWIRIAGGRIAAHGHGDPPEPAPEPAPGPGDSYLGGSWVLPGFTDVHVHGGGGFSFTEGGPEDARRAALFHRAHGSTRIVASLVTAPADELAARVALLASLADDGLIDGIHLEGPFLSAVRCGAQDPRYLIAPDVELFDRLHQAARGHLKIITIAPELPGATELIRAATAAGVVAAAGHTDASYETTVHAIDAGVAHATHLFNGMRPLEQRQPGPAGALLDQQVSCEAICDGTHLHDATVRLIARAAGPGNLVLVTDAMAAAGMPDGGYRLGQQEVTVSGGVARLAEGAPGAGSIAGSTATMAHIVRHAITSAGLPVTDVAAAAATTPARIIGLSRDTGAIEPGLAADLVVLDDNFRLARTMARGVWVS
ncbi:MAG TPA: N-acetylglucosamine-6-phosphate deacetylase [Streptosporangiaceae bacterium]|nr:N-acetylglucosamine-6-phosphate deacetylase [Streptosporangiaceae bacterium]